MTGTDPLTSFQSHQEEPERPDFIPASGCSALPSRDHCLLFVILTEKVWGTKRYKRHMEKVLDEEFPPDPDPPTD